MNIVKLIFSIICALSPFEQSVASAVFSGADQKVMAEVKATVTSHEYTELLEVYSQLFSCQNDTLGEKFLEEVKNQYAYKVKLKLEDAGFTVSDLSRDNNRLVGMITTYITGYTLGTSSRILRETISSGMYAKGSHVCTKLENRVYKSFYENVN